MTSASMGAGSPTPRPASVSVRARLSALEFIDLVADPGSWQSWDSPVAGRAADTGYRAELDEARRRSGADEAVLTGSARIYGRRLAAVIGEFHFLAGSIGLAASARLIAAIERATRERLPLLAAPASGGTRIQEGPAAFVQMAAITRAITEHRSAGLPYLVFLRDPTVGGVLASWGSLGHLTVAEPGALIGFTGPRVFESLHGRPFPAGVQVAENLLAHGLIDAVVQPSHLPAVAARALDVLAAALSPPAPGLTPGAPPAPRAVTDQIPGSPPPRRGAWDVVTSSRDPARPGVRALLRHGAQCVTPLHGTGEGGNAAGLVLALARFGAAPAVLAGHDRAAEIDGHPVGPAALGIARRGIRLAAELRLPLVTVIDTVGAELSRQAEERGLAAEIARCLAELVTLPSPTLAVLMGQGSGGAALALLPADRVIAAENRWLSALPPEGASVIRHRTSARAAEIAESMDISARALLRHGIVDQVIEENGDTAARPVPFLRRLGTAIEAALRGLLAEEAAERLARRTRGFQALGRPDGANPRTGTPSEGW